MNALTTLVQVPRYVRTPWDHTSAFVPMEQQTQRIQARIIARVQNYFDIIFVIIMKLTESARRCQERLNTLSS